MGENTKKYHITDDGDIYRINEDGSFTSIGNVNTMDYEITQHQKGNEVLQKQLIEIQSSQNLIEEPQETELQLCSPCQSKKVKNKWYSHKNFLAKIIAVIIILLCILFFIRYIRDPRNFFIRNYNVVYPLNSNRSIESIIFEYGFWNCCIVERNCKKGVTGGFFHSEIIPLMYDRIIADRWNHIFIVCLDKKWGLMSEKGEQLVNFTYQKLESLQKDLISAKNDGKYGCIDSYGNVVIPYMYDKLGILCYNDNRMILVNQNGLWGVVDRNNYEVIPIIYDEIQTNYFNIDRIRARKNGKWGIVDNENNTIVPFKYDNMTNCSYYGEDAFLVSHNGKWGVIDNNNYIVVPVIYDKIEEKHDDLSILLVVKNGEKSKIDLSKL